MDPLILCGTLSYFMGHLAIPGTMKFPPLLTVTNKTTHKFPKCAPHPRDNKVHIDSSIELYRATRYVGTYSNFHCVTDNNLTIFCYGVMKGHKISNALVYTYIHIYTTATHYPVPHVKASLGKHTILPVPNYAVVSLNCYIKEP